MVKQLRVSAIVFALLALVAAAAVTPARAQQPSATVQLQLLKGGFIIGLSGGAGVLYFQGQAYPLSIGGISIGATIGAASADLIGEVYNLYSPYDIQGIYSATRSSYAVAGGDAAAYLQNTRGVELHLRGKEVGLEFSVDLSGMSISLTQ